MKLILASNSPRRRELLARYGYEFEVEPSLFEESAKGLSAYDTVAAFARGKAEEVLSRFPGDLILGADTVVELDGEILGKPQNAEHARAMLRALSGREHRVLTGVAFAAAGYLDVSVVISRVFFNPLSEELIRSYVESGLPFGKAGAYGIQDGYPLAERIEGDYTNIVGLPMQTVGTMYERAPGGKR